MAFVILKNFKNYTPPPPYTLKINFGLLYGTKSPKLSLYLCKNLK